MRGLLHCSWHVTHFISDLGEQRVLTYLTQVSIWLRVTVSNNVSTFLAFYRIKLTANVKVCVKLREFHTAKRTWSKNEYFLPPSWTVISKL